MITINYHQTLKQKRWKICLDALKESPRTVDELSQIIADIEGGSNTSTMRLYVRNLLTASKIGYFTYDRNTRMYFLFGQKKQANARISKIKQETPSTFEVFTKQVHEFIAANKQTDKRTMEEALGLPAESQKLSKALGWLRKNKFIKRSRSANTFYYTAKKK